MDVRQFLFVLFVVLIPIISIAAPKVEYLHPDHLGRTVMITDADQQVLWEAQYKPFGEVEVLYDPNGWGDQFGFPGQHYDKESGYYYNYYRDYDPTLGRYVQSDPRGVILDYSDPQRQVAAYMGLPLPIDSFFMDLNQLYGYADQNPLSNIDPTGEFWSKIPKALKAVGVTVQGPRPNKKGDGGMICQVLYKNKPIFRIEQHPLNPTDRTPIPHWHMAPNMKKHRQFPEPINKAINDYFN